MADVALDLTDIVSEFGAIYRANGQSAKDIRKKIFVGSETDKLFAKQLTEHTQLQGGKAIIDPVLQAYQDAFTPKGDMTITGKKIDLVEIKVDWQKNPHSLIASWAGFLTTNDHKPETWPFAKWLIEEHIMPQMMEDWELSAVYTGVKGSITAGTATASSAIIDGIKKIINLGIAASEITPIVLGAVPTDPVEFVDYVEAFADAIPEHVKPYLQDIAMSQTLYKRFKKGMRAKYNMSYAQADLVTVIDTNLKVSGFRSHEGSTKIWTTIKGNAVMGIKHASNESYFAMESSKRVLSIFTNFFKGMGFWDNSYVYTNDVETS